MALGWRKGSLFAAGLLLGIGLGAWAVVGPLHAVHGPVPVAQADSEGSSPDASADLQVPAGPLRCDLGPIVPKAGSGDGLRPLQAHPGGATASEVASQILSGKEAAASGHHRDAEVAFLNACHSAEAVPGHDAALVADADYQLARLYGNLATTGGPHAAELRKRAEQLYGASLAAYRTRYGENGEKTRFATEGLAALERRLQQPSETAVAAAEPKAAEKPHAAAHPLPKPRETLAAVPLAQRTERTERSAPAPKPAAPAQVDSDSHADADAHAHPAHADAPATASGVAVSPSFDCARARSASEKMICSDPELAREDRELGRLHARAEAEATDRPAFRRHNDAEWQRREETCHDRDCVQRWYDQRREQLQQDLDASSDNAADSADRDTQ